MLAVAGNLVAACGSPSTAATPTPTAPPSPTSAVSPTPTDDPRNAAVIGGYLAEIRAFVHAGTTVDPNDPQLVATMTGDQLSTVKKNLIIDRAGGLVGRGDITSMHPHVVSIDGTTAVVKDCVYSALLLYDAKTGGPAPGNANGPQDVAITATLVYVDGVWKVSLQDGRFGSCPPGY